MTESQFDLGTRLYRHAERCGRRADGDARQVAKLRRLDPGHPVIPLYEDWILAAEVDERDARASAAELYALHRAAGTRVLTAAQPGEWLGGGLSAKGAKGSGGAEGDAEDGQEQGQGRE